MAEISHEISHTGQGIDQSERQFDRAGQSDPAAQPDPAESEPTREIAESHDPAAEEPLVFNAPSLARTREDHHEEVSNVRFELAEASNDESPAEEAAEEIDEVPGEPALQINWQEAALDQLGLVQLVQRLSHTIEKRRELIVQAHTEAANIAATSIIPTELPAELAPELPPELPAELEAAPAAEAAQAMAAYFGGPTSEKPAETHYEIQHETAVAAEIAESAPEEAQTAQQSDLAARLSHLSSSGGNFDKDSDGHDEDDEGFAESSVLPMKRTDFSHAPTTLVTYAQNPAQNLAIDDSDIAEPTEAEPTENNVVFTSLMEMQNPFHEQEEKFVRIEEPEAEDEDTFRPSVIFPSQEQVTPGAGHAAQHNLEQETEQDLAIVGETAPQARPFDPPSATPDEADEALREALAKLQRMSGAA